MPWIIDLVGSLSFGALLAFLVASFVLSGILGFKFYRSGSWNLVDLIYYPLAAVGILLFFLAAQTQRDMLRESRLADESAKALAALEAEKPKMTRFADADMLEGGLGWFHMVKKWGELCSRPTGLDPRCMVPESLFSLVDSFLEVAEADQGSYEARLARTCVAGDDLLSAIANERVFSASVSERMARSYLDINSKRLSFFEYGRFLHEVEVFSNTALKDVRYAHRMAFAPEKEDEASRLVLGIGEAEVEFATMILQGLYPCVISEKSNLEALVNWEKVARARGDDKRRAERNRDQLKEALPDPLVHAIQLNLWPFVIIFALSLKFAKGMAAMRKHIVEKTPIPASNDRPEDGTDQPALLDDRDGAGSGAALDESLPGRRDEMAEGGFDPARAATSETGETFGESAAPDES